MNAGLCEWLENKILIFFDRCKQYLTQLYHPPIHPSSAILFCANKECILNLCIYVLLFWAISTNLFLINFRHKCSKCSTSNFICFYLIYRKEITSFLFLLNLVFSESQNNQLVTLLVYFFNSKFNQSVYIALKLVWSIYSSYHPIFPCSKFKYHPVNLR